MKLLPLNASQTIAAVAICAALVAGAYAIGRSQNSASAPALASGLDEPVATLPAAAPKPRAPAVVADATPTRQARLCDECARVVEVHSELHQGKASGIGAVGGAVLGGLLGNQIGGGNGRKIATVGGAVAGGYAGNEIEKNRNQQRVWVVRYVDRDGVTQRHQQAENPQLKAGDVIVVRDGRIERRQS